MVTTNICLWHSGTHLNWGNFKIVRAERISQDTLLSYNDVNSTVSYSGSYRTKKHQLVRRIIIWSPWSSQWVTHLYVLLRSLLATPCPTPRNSDPHPNIWMPGQHTGVVIDYPRCQRKALLTDSRLIRGPLNQLPQGGRRKTYRLEVGPVGCWGRPHGPSPILRGPSALSGPVPSPRSGQQPKSVPTTERLHARHLLPATKCFLKVSLVHSGNRKRKIRTTISIS